MRVLVGCERSGRVREAFKAKGHNAWSCDIEPSDIPGQHIQTDIFNVLYDEWDLGIFFPPCTYISYVANRHWNRPGRAELRQDAVQFFLGLANAPIDKISLENPVGYMNTIWRKPDQIIHPYYFGEPYQKRTCLWLKNLPRLEYGQTIIPKPPPLYICEGEKSKGKAINWVEGIKGSGKERATARSQTFQNVANAMADQWSNPVNYQEKLFI